MKNLYMILETEYEYVDGEHEYKCSHRRYALSYKTIKRLYRDAVNSWAYIYGKDKAVLDQVLIIAEDNDIIGHRYFGCATVRAGNESTDSLCVIEFLRLEIEE